MRITKTFLVNEKKQMSPVRPEKGCLLWTNLRWIQLIITTTKDRETLLFFLSQWVKNLKQYMVRTVHIQYCISRPTVLCVQNLWGNTVHLV